MRVHRRYVFRLLVAFCAAHAIAPRDAAAVVDGTPLALWKRYKLYGSAWSVGNTMMSSADGLVNTSGPFPSSAMVDIDQNGTSGIPLDATVESAFLFWSASGPPTVDTTADLTVPGRPSVSVSADRCLTYSGYGGSYACRADVTAQVRAGSITGNYTVGGVQATAGNCQIDPSCQSKYAGWSLVIVWSSPTYNKQRDIVLYDGFRHTDETCTHGWDTFTLSGFTVGNQALGEITLFALEGDRLLGVPPQDDPQSEAGYCPECVDFLALNNGTTSVRLQDNLNPSGNLFNSSINRGQGGTAVGVDLDTFDIGTTGLNVLKPGLTQLGVTWGAGDGVITRSCAPCGGQYNPPAGCGDRGYGGESIMLQYLLLKLDTLAPNFRGSRTTKTVDPTTAGEGETLYYTINVTNEGSQDATNVILQDSIPANTTYVANSTKVNGVAQGDVGGTSPLVAGLNVGSIPWSGPNNFKTITFRVRTNTGIPLNVTTVTNTASIRSDQTPDPAYESAVTTIDRSLNPALGTPSKVAVDGTGGFVEPSDIIFYVVTIPNTSDRRADGVSFEDVIDDDLNIASFIMTSQPAGSTVTLPTAQNGRKLTVSGFSVAAGGSATITYALMVDSVAGFAARGIPVSQINGRQIRNQGKVNAPFLQTPLLTDSNINNAIPNEPTVLTISYAPQINIVKGAQDTNGGRLEPGDVVAYTINVANGGNLAATVQITDTMPAGFTYNPASLALPSGASATFAAGGGVNGTGVLTISNARVDGATVQNPSPFVSITFSGTIKADAPHQLVVKNCLTSTIAEAPSQTPSACDTGLTVYNSPVLVVTKAVVDPNAGGVEPDDLLTYTITIRNDGNKAARNIVITDAIDANLTITSAGSGNFANGAITWTSAGTPALATLSPGATTSVAFTARVNTVQNGTVIANQAQVRSDEIVTAVPSDDPSTPAAGDPTKVTVQALPNFTTSTKDVANQSGHPRTASEPGDTLLYTIVVKNTGRGIATNTVVTDIVDGAALENIVVTQGTGSVQFGTITWNLGTIAPNLPITLAFTARLKPVLPNGYNIDNQARIVADSVAAVPTDDPTTPAPADPTRVTVSSRATLQVTKTVTDGNGGQPQPGDPFTWTIVISNTGNAPARDVVVIDVVDTNLTSIVPAQSGAFANGQIRWDTGTTLALASVNPGSPVTLSFASNAKFPLASETVVSNQAQVTSNDVVGTVLSDDPARPGAADPTRVTLISAPEFALSTKTFVDENGGETRPRDSLLWTVTANNSGTEVANDVVVTDQIDPACFTNVRDVSDSGQFAGNTITWRLTQLGLRTTKAFTFRADIRAPLDDNTICKNQAFVSSREITTPVPSDDPRTPAQGDETKVTVRSAPDFAGSTKEVATPQGTPTRPGHALNYTITVTNKGTMTAKNVAVTDVVDVTNLTDVVVGENGVLQGNTITWLVPTLAPDAQTKFTFSAKVKVPTDNGTIISNQGEIRSTEIQTPVKTDDPRTTEANDPTKVTIISASDLTGSTKRVRDVNGGVVEPGDTLEYTIAVTNRGDAVAKDVVVTDPIDPNLEAVAPGAGGTYAAGQITWSKATTPALANIAPAQTVTLIFTARVISPLDNATEIANQATMTWPGSVTPAVTDDPTTPALNDKTKVSVVSSVKLAATKTAAVEAGGDPEPKKKLVYTLKVKNDGNAPARNVVVLDLVDTTKLEAIEPQDGARLQGGTVTWDGTGNSALIRLVKGTDVTLRFKATIKSPMVDGTEVLNQGTVSAQDGSTTVTDDPATTPPLDKTKVVVKSRPNLSTTTLAATDVNGGNPAPGDALRYALVITNTGTDAAHGVTATIPGSQFWTNVAVENGGTFDPQTRLVSWANIGDIAAGASATVAFTASIPQPLDNGTVVSAQATVRASNLATPEVSDDPATPNIPDDPTTLIVVSAPDFTKSTKAAVAGQNGVLRPGDTVSYTITVRNDGTANARNVIVRDTLDPGLDAASAVPLDGGRVVGGVVTWDSGSVPALVSMAPGASVTLRLSAKVAKNVADGLKISNTATISADGNASFTTLAAVVTVAFADLGGTTLSYVDGNAGLREPGDPLTYTLTVTNRGSFDAPSVVVTLPVDANLDAVAPGAGGTIQGGAVLWNSASTPALALVRARTSVTLPFTAKIRELIPGATIISAQAKLESTALIEPVQSDDPATPAVADATKFTVTAAPRLDQSTKVIDNLPASRELEPGQRLTYTIRVKNTGNTLATNVVVTDAIDPRLIDVVPSTGGVLAAGTVTWSAPAVGGLASMKPRDELAFTVNARIDSSAPSGVMIDNQARLRSTEFSDGVVTDDPTTPAIGDKTSFRIRNAPNFSGSTIAVRDDNSGELRAGDTLTYTITAKNSGSLAATVTRVVSTPPRETDYVPGSTRVNGVGVVDEGAGGNPLALGLTVQSPGGLAGVVGPGETATVNYQVRLRSGVSGGTIVSARATIDALETNPFETGAVEIVVGRGANIDATALQFGIAVDLGAPGIVDVGDTIEVTATIPNDGNARATGVTYTHTLPAGVSFVAGSLKRNGTPVADPTPSTAIRVDIGALSPATRATVTYRLRAETAGVVALQGTVATTEGLSEPTDNPTTSAINDATLVTIGNVPVRAFSVTKEAAAAEGGAVKPGGKVRYTVRVTNTGNEPLLGAVLNDNIPARATYVEGSATGLLNTTATLAPGGRNGRGELSVAGFKVDVGQSLAVSYLTTIDATTPCATAITNSVDVSATDTTPQSATASLLTCTSVGTAALRARAFRDVGTKNRVFDPTTDEALTNYQIVVTRKASLDAPLRSALTDRNGRSDLYELPPGDLVARCFNAQGTEFARADLGNVRGGDLKETDIPVDPSGVIYNSQTGAGLSGITLYIYYDDTDATKPGQIVPGVELPFPTQQGQRTGEDGTYGFDVFAGRKYKLVVATAGESQVWPSVKIPATPGFAVGQPPDGKVVPNDRPDITKATTHYARFNIVDASSVIRNNHVPIDPIASLIVLDKRANKKTVSTGEVVTYTVRVQNGSTRDLVVDPSNGTGGMSVQDETPRGFRYIKGSTRAKRVVGSSAQLYSNGSADPSGSTLLKFGPYDVRAGDTLEVMYQLVVAASVRVGEYRNRATAFGSGNVAVSNTDDALVRVVADPIFDQATILGKVFCDANKNGWQDSGDFGVAGARVYIDSGYYATTDTFGKYHLKDIDPGLHLVKIDTDTLPPGSTLTTPERFAVILTRGLVTKVNFGVDCKFDVVGVDDVERKGVKPKRTFDTTRRTFAGNRESLAVAMARPGEAARAIPGLAVDLAVTNTDKTPADFAAAKGFNGALGESGRAILEPLHFATKVSGNPLRWTLDVRDADGALVHALAGTGRPPTAVRWNGTNDAGAFLLATGQAYRVRLTVTDARGSQAMSPTRAFGVEYGVKREATGEIEAWSETLGGQLKKNLFVGRSPTPSPALVEMLGKVVARMRENPKRRLAIEVHSDNRRGRLESQLASERRALEVRRTLIDKFKLDAARVSARGLGLSKPKNENRTARDRAANRRIEVRAYDPGEIKIVDAGRPPEAPTHEAWVRVNGESVETDSKGAWGGVWRLPKDGLFVVDMQRATGHRVVRLVQEDGLAKPEEAADVDFVVSIKDFGYQVGSDVGALDLLKVSLAVDPTSAVLSPTGKLQQRIAFIPKWVAKPIKRWRVGVEGPSGAKWEMTGGDKELPPSIPWSVDDRAALATGTYHARLIIEDESSGIGESPRVAFALAREPLMVLGGAPGHDDIVLRGPLFRGTETTALLKQELNKHIPALAKKISAGRRFAIEAHAGIVLRRERVEQVEKATAAQAETVRKMLVDAKLAPEAFIEARGFGLTKPLVPNTTNANRLLNRRIVIRALPVVKAPDPPVAPPAVEPSLSVNGDFRPLTDQRFEGRIRVRPGEAILLDARSAAGNRAFVVVRPRFPKPEPKRTTPELPPVLPQPTPAPSPKPAPATEPPKDDDVPLRRRRPSVSAPASAEDFNAKAQRSKDARNETSFLGVSAPLRQIPAPASDLVTPTPLGGGTVMVASASSVVTEIPASAIVRNARVVLAQADDDRPLRRPRGESQTPTRAHGADAGAAPPETPDGAIPGSFRGFGSTEMETAIEGKKALPPVRAAKLRAHLPPRGVVIKSDTLTVWGDTDPTNRVRVNGKPATVLADGEFAIEVKLAPGASTLTIETVDTDGNRGRLEWPVDVKPTQFFLLALAEGTLGAARNGGIEGTFDGVTPATASALGDSKSVLIHGRTVVYFKGRIQGNRFFKDVRLTAHFDTAKQKEFEALFRQIIDPNKFYPVYGDAAGEVRDVEARDKLYVLVEADESRLIVGNFKTDFRGIELLQYSRAFYGAKVDFVKQFSKKFGQEIRAFGSRDDFTQKHAHIEFRGTGGSLYYLKHTEIVEGSERVRMVIRDKDTGLELWSAARARDVDYTLLYREGRLLMKSPVPSIVDASFLATTNGLVTLNGHPVLLEVDYEYTGELRTGGTSFGFQFRERLLGDLLTFGGTYAEERRDGVANPTYRIWGTELKLQRGQAYVTGEFARSESVDADSSYSDDGGLSFRAFGNTTANAMGAAYKFEAGAEWGEFRKTAKKDWFKTRAYYQRLEPGFFASGKRLDQGQHKFGLTAKLFATEKDDVVVRHDGIFADIFQNGDIRSPSQSMQRQLSTVAFTHREKRWAVTAEFTQMFSSQFMNTIAPFSPLLPTSTLPSGGDFNQGTLAGGFDYKLTDWLALFAQQQAIVYGSDGLTLSSDFDRFTTTIGGRLSLTKQISIALAESVRWNGENATTVGLKAQLTDDLNVYVNERFTNPRDRGSLSTTIVGAENRFGPEKNSRTYGEYQIEGGSTGRQSRAVMGVGHRIPVAKGFTLDVGYERSQVDSPGVTEKSSRDALSVGAEFVKRNRLKASTRQEIRVDEVPIPAVDKFQFLTLNALLWQFTRDVTFFARGNYSHTLNTTTRATDAESLELTTGLAFRPVQYDWVNLIFKYTKFIDQRPIDPLAGTKERLHTDVVAINPIFETPFRLQLSLKFAWKRDREKIADLPIAVVDSLQWIARAAYHLARWPNFGLDVAAEGRGRYNLLASNSEAGALFEVAFIIAKYARIGAGYNFTRFSDDEIAKASESFHGWFVRLVGQY
ncbi:MAG: DUF11 domain-containing protein [Deltaproteobacteria bacterium]|nr:DUF11 domain-containing protein [Deltaproteobacteria bacterium]